MSRGYIARSKRNDWCTPREVLDPVYETFDGHLDLDPCANRKSLVQATEKYYLSRGQDGLALPWVGKVFVNPPFDNVSGWLEKAYLEHDHFEECIFLMPARTDTKAWHRYGTTADGVCFWKGRLRFLGASASAPFPTALLYWGWNMDGFREAFEKHGQVIWLLD